MSGNFASPISLEQNFHQIRFVLNFSWIKIVNTQIGNYLSTFEVQIHKIALSESQLNVFCVCLVRKTKTKTTRAVKGEINEKWITKGDFEAKTKLSNKIFIWHTFRANTSCKKEK